MPSLSRVADNVPEFFVLSIDRMANKAIREGKDIIKLNLGKSEVPMPSYVVEEMTSKLNDGKQREIIDSQGLLPLREEVAREHSRGNHPIRPEQVFINNGTSPFFVSLFLLLVNPEEEILFPRPYYPTYIAAANMANVGRSFYSITDGRINFEEFEKNFVRGKTKVVFLNSPGNPFGNVHTKEELQRVLDIVRGDAFIISDEIYDGFVYDHNFVSILDVYDPSRDQVVVLNGFSKIHHMYTRRLGYAIVTPEIAPALLRYQQHSVVCVDPVTQYGGLISLKNKGQLIEEEIKREVEDYAGRLATCELLMQTTRLKLIRPSGSFYMCIDVSGYLNDKAPNSLTLAQQILEKTNIAVTPGEDFGRTDFFRISLTSGRVIEGMTKLCAYLKTL